MSALGDLCTRKDAHENPLPATEVSNAGHLGNTASDGRREARDHNRQDIETRHALLDFPANIPCTDDVCASGEESSLEDAK